MEAVYFMIKYTPFWAIPLSFISAQYCLVYHQRFFRKTSLFFLLTGFLSIFSLAFFIWAGNGDAAIKYFMEFKEEYVHN